MDKANTELTPAAANELSLDELDTISGGKPDYGFEIKAEADTDKKAKVTVSFTIKF